MMEEINNQFNLMAKQNEKLRSNIFKTITSDKTEYQEQSQSKKAVKTY